MLQFSNNLFFIINFFEFIFLGCKMKNFRKQKRDKITDKILSTIYQPKTQTKEHIASSIQPRLQNNFFISYNQNNNAGLKSKTKTNTAIKNLNININFSGQSIQSQTNNVDYRQKHNLNKMISDNSEVNSLLYFHQNRPKQSYIKANEFNQNFKKHAFDPQFKRKTSKSKSKNRYKDISKEKNFDFQTQCIKKERCQKKQFLNNSIEEIYSNKKRKFKSLQKGIQQKKRKFRLFTLNTSNQSQNNQKIFKERYKSIQFNLKQRSPASQRLNRSNNLKNKRYQEVKSNNSSSKQFDLSHTKKEQREKVLQSASKFINSKNNQYGYESFKIQNNIQFKNRKLCLNQMERPRRLLTYQSLSKSSQKLKLLGIKQKSNLSSKQLLIKRGKNFSQNLENQFKQCQQLAQLASFQQSQVSIQKVLVRLNQNKIEHIKIYRDLLQLKATNCFNLGQYNNCIKVIDQIFKITRQFIQSLDKPNKKLYILAAISWNQLNNDKSENKLTKIIQYLQKCSFQNPEWSQPYDFLGKIHYEHQFYQKAIEYFQLALKVNQRVLRQNKYLFSNKQQFSTFQNKKNIQKFLCKRLKTVFNVVECFKSLNLLDRATQILQTQISLLISSKSQNIYQLVKKGLIQLINLHYFLRQYQICLQKLQEYSRRFLQEECFKQQNLKYEIIFLKAHIYNKIGNKYQSIMLFEQILPLVSSLISTLISCKKSSQESIKKQKQLLNNIVSHMIIIKIQQRDFYEASHLIERCKYFNINQNQLKIQKLFVFGVVQIMKKKFDQGLQHLQSVCEQLLKLKQKQSKIQKKQNKNQNLFFVFDIEKPTLQIQKYVQMYLAYGYFCNDNLIKTKSAIQSQFLINRLSKNYQKNFETYFQNSLNYNLNLCQGLICLKLIKEDNNQKTFQQALEHFNKAILYFQKPQPYFYLCLLYAKKVFIQNIEQIKQFKKVNLLQVEMQININRCINLVNDMNNNFSATAFYYRSLFYCYKKKWTLALSDIDEAIQRSEQNFSHYFYLKALVLASCQNFKQAISEASVAISLDQKAAENYLLRSRCLQIQGDGNQAFLDLQTYITLKPDDCQIHKYAGHLLFQNGAFEDAIMAYSQGSLQSTTKSSIQVNFHVYLTRSKTYFLLGDFQNASQDMLSAFQLRQQERQYYFDYKMMCFLNQLISIMEKIQQVQTIQNTGLNKMLENLLLKLNTIKKQEGVFDQTKQSCKKDQIKKQKINQIKKTDASQQKKCFGKIFKQVEIHMLKFTILFYLKQYEECIIQLNKCIKLKQQSFLKNNLKKLNQQEDEAQYEQQQNQKKMFINQMRYNLSIVYLKLKKFDLASNILQSCSIEQNSKNYQAWELLIAQINFKEKVNLKQSYAQVFSIKNKLSKYFPSIQVFFGQDETSVRTLNVCVPYPKVEPPQINPKFDEKLIINFSQNSIQRKPEAPWIIKQQNSIKFTDKMQNYSRLDIQESQISYSRKGGLLKQKFDQSDIMNYQQEQSYHCLKEKLKLDEQLQKKINKFISK